LQQLAELPKCFVREFGDVIDPYVILRDPNNNEFEVHVIKRSRKMYFQDGWIGLKDVYDMRFGAWVRFTYRDPRLLTIRVTTRWGEEVKYPASNPPLRRLLSRVGFDIESGFPKSSFSSSANVISNSFVRSYVKELTYHDVHSGVLVLVLLIYIYILPVIFVFSLLFHNFLSRFCLGLGLVNMYLHSLIQIWCWLITLVIDLIVF
jgi:hypothetical protein